MRRRWAFATLRRVVEDSRGRAQHRHRQLHGGCGKTTTSVNVAAELAACGRRTLLLDLDPQGHATLALGARKRPHGVTAHDLMFGEAPAGAQPIRIDTAGVDLFPADLTCLSRGARPRARALAEALGPIGQSYDYVIIDTRPTVELPLVSALAAAHYAITPTQLTPLAHDGASRFSQVSFYVSTQLNPKLKPLGIVPVQVDLRTRVHRAVLDRLAEDFGSAKAALARRVRLSTGGRPHTRRLGARLPQGLAACKVCARASATRKAALTSGCQQARAIVVFSAASSPT